MTDKQIIFDDVDVKDCIAYAKSQTVYLGNTLYNQAENICMVKNQPCKFFDCQFKEMSRKLKRKEQECEELKKEREKAIQDKSNTFLDLFKTEKELGYLKEALEKEFITYRLDGFVPVFTYKGYELDKLIEKNRQLKAENEQLKNFHINLVGVKECEIRELANYKQAIEKIKEIAESQNNLIAYDEDIDYESFDFILEICDEVNKDDVEDDLSGHWLFDKEV